VTERPAPWKRRSFGFHVQLEAWSGIVERLRGTPVRARALASGSGEERLGRRPDPRSWSAKEHIGHLLDLEALDVRRLAEYLAGAETLSAGDPTNHATESAHHNAKPIETILGALASGRAGLVRRLETLSEADLVRSALHPRLQQPMRLIDWAHFVAEHDDHHLASASAALKPSIVVEPGPRALFDIPNDVTYLNCASVGPQLRAVAEAGQKAIHARFAPWTLASTDWFTGAEELRRLAASLMHADVDGIALVPAVSYGIAIAAKNASVREGKSIVLLDQEFPSNVYAWRTLAAARGGRVVTVTREAGQPWAEAVERAIDDSTAVVSVPACHWTDGSLVDLERVGARAQAVGAMFVIDASQSLGAARIDVGRLQPDFLVSVGYKWQLGPYGLGYLYAAPKWREHGSPLEESWITRRDSEDFSQLVHYRDEFRPGARRFDMGEFAQFVLTPMAAAALRQILTWTVEHIHGELSRLTDHAARLATEDGWAVDPPEQRIGHMIGVRMPGGVPRALGAALSAEKIYVSVRGDAIRIAPHLYNTTADIDRLFAVLDRMRDARIGV